MVLKSLLFVFLFVSPFISRADTLDFWSVHLNDSLLANFNSFSESIKDLTIESNDWDTLVIRYNNDHPCQNCEYYYTAKNTEGEKLFVKRQQGDKRFEQVQIPVSIFSEYKGLLELENSNSFEIFLYIHGDSQIEGEYISLARVIIKE